MGVVVESAYQGRQAGLGRLPRFDPRSLNFPMQAAPTGRRSRQWPLFLKGGPLDQRDTSECVIYSADHFMKTLPVVNKGFADSAERTRVYKEVQRLDQWYGEDYDGTSVLAMMKWLKSKGYIREYRWGRTVADVVNHLLEVGPVVMGTIWTEEMFKGDRWGFIHPEGEVVGGHAYLLSCVNLDKIHPVTKQVGAVRIVNSWGKGWNDKGRAWLSLDDLDYLIQQDGEAAAAVEVKKVA